MVMVVVPVDDLDVVVVVSNHVVDGVLYVMMVNGVFSHGLLGVIDVLLDGLLGSWLFVLQVTSLALAEHWWLITAAI